LTVGAIPLTVKADPKVIFKGDPLPTFTSTYTGFINNDISKIVSGPDYNLSPTYNNTAGTYRIIPSNLVLQNQDSYTITYVFDTLYVNPSGPNAKNVKPKLECVEPLKKPVNGFSYLAHFSYTNPNSTIVYVPRGSENLITALGPYSGLQPTEFLPGTNYFDIYFDGQKMTWTLITYNGNQKSSSSSDASSSSAKCTSHYVTTVVSSRVATVSGGPTVVPADALIKFGVYPNPVKDNVTISFEGANLQQKDIKLYDLPGRLQQVKGFSKMNAGSAVLDLSNLVPGVYILSVQVNNENKTAVIVKL